MSTSEYVRNAPQFDYEIVFDKSKNKLVVIPYNKMDKNTSKHTNHQITDREKIKENNENDFEDIRKGVTNVASDATDIVKNVIENYRFGDITKGVLNGLNLI
eukprot:253952_1